MMYLQLDEVEKVTNNTMQVFFDQFIPEDYHEVGHIMVEGCIEEYCNFFKLNLHFLEIV